MPEPVPDQQTPTPMPEIDIELCELEAFTMCLRVASPELLSDLADHCPRRIPQKARSKQSSLLRMLLVRWVWPDARTFFRRDFLLNASAISRFRTQGLNTLQDALEEELPPAAIVWFAAQAGINPQEVLSALPDDVRDALWEDLQGYLPNLRQALLHERDRRQTEGASALDAAAKVRAQQLTKALRWEADRARTKLERTQRSAESAVRKRSAQVRELQRQLEEARAEIARLELEVAAAREQITEISRAHAERTALLSARIRQIAEAKGLHLPLAGEDVLVVGDDGRKVEYRSIVEELGGAFSFLSGFDNPDRIDTSGASLIVFVTAYASHKAFDHVQSAEAAGTRVILVSQAGAQSFRNAVLAAISMP